MVNFVKYIFAPTSVKIGSMIADISVVEKSFGDKALMSGVKFSIDDGEKVGLVGRNGVGKSTLFGILAGTDTDFTGDITYRRGLTVVATAQEHHNLGEQTVLQYILSGLPEYAELSQIIATYPETMGDDMKKIEAYTNALERFEQKGFYQIEEQIERELDNFQLTGVGTRPFASLSGGQKRLVEVVKIMHSQAHLALIDEPTNHMDYVAKQQFIDWMKGAQASKTAMLVITHDRDVLEQVDRIVELKDGLTVSYRGNYDAYLKQNAASTSTGIHDHEMLERRRANLRDKVMQFRRLKERARDPGTIQQFKRREVQAAAELAELEEIEKPTFWIDKNSRESLDFKAASRYDKYKSRNIKMNMKDESSRSSHVLVKAVNVSLGYDTPLFEGVNIDLREGEAVELRGRNGAGKSTLIKALLENSPSLLTKFSETASRRVSSGALAPGETRAADVSENLSASGITQFAGELSLDSHARVGVYEQEVAPTYFELPLHDAIERTYSDQQLSISETKIRQLAADYLFTEADLATPVEKLSGGQKARLQIIAMLANDPQLLILDEPTNHLDLPSIEELETALAHYGGAVLFVSHDGYFREALGGEVIKIGA